ncbi:DUF5719 family protein [Agrococcus casei]|uniref:DUF5719 family protein n=1 Tax=Agrococcus casei TaxID=343512 RepID=UPI003F8DDD52
MSDERDAWDEAGAIPVTGEDLEQGRQPSAPSADEPHGQPDKHDQHATLHDDPEELAKLATDTDIASDVTATDAEAQWNADAEARLRANPKTVALWSGRSLLGLVAIGAAVALGVGAVWAAGSGAFAVDREPVSEQITPMAGEQQIVCAPGQLRVQSGEGGSTSIVPVSDANPVVPELEGAETAQLPIGNVEGAELTSVQAPVGDSVLGGMSWTSADDAEIAGLSGAACTSPAASQWLVGGATTTGRSSIIVLANPSEQPTTVRLEVFTTEGPADSAANSAITIEPGTATAIDLASLSVDNASPAVLVRSEGSAVAAFMQHSIIRGLEPGGIDTISGQPAATTDQTFVGVPLSGRTSANVDGDGSDVQSTLRLVAAEDTVVRIEFSSPGTNPTTTEVPLAAGTVIDMDLSALPEGDYTIDIQSDAPVAAGMRSLPADGSVVADFVWLSPSRTIDGEVTVDARPRGHDRELVVYNASDDTQVIEVDGTEHELVAGALFSMELGQDPVVLRGSGIRASVVMTDDGLIAGYSVQPAPPAAAAVTVEY